MCWSIAKTDLAPLGPDLVRRLDALNDRAPRILARDAGEPGALLFGLAPLRATLPLPSLPPAHHSHGIDAFAIILEGPVSRLDFARALGGLAGARGNDLLRVKGIVRFADRPERPAVVQAAQHSLFAPEWLDDWPDRGPIAAASSLSSTTSRAPKSSPISPSPRPAIWPPQPLPHS